MSESENEKPNDFRTWFFTVLHLFLFVSILCFFHIVLNVAYLFRGRKAFNGPLEAMCCCLNWNIRFTGTDIGIHIHEEVPKQGPVILVGNHQNMYDIPFAMYELRRFHPRYIAKKELAKKLPAISFALRRGDHLAIDRKDPSGSVALIKEWAADMNARGESVGLYAEGTRARDGKLKRFKTSGFKAVRAQMGDVPVIPVAVDGMWKLMRYKFWPIPYGGRVDFHVLPPIEQKGKSDEQILEECREAIAAVLKQS